MTASKPVAQSAIDEHTYKVFPNDLNSYGTVFGGLIMSILDRVTLVVAERHSGCICVTASVDAMHFLAPAKASDTLVFKAAVNRTWKSSMEIGAKVVAENSYTGEERHILSSYFTFVALDQSEKPTEVPQVIPQSDIEKHRFAAAQIRRDMRLKHKQDIANLHQQERNAAKKT